jgi:hypothetical protein
MHALVRALVCSVVSLWLVAGSALGQDAPAIDRIKVSLWPEYDKPEMLVLVEAWLDPGSALPTTLAVPIPAAAGAPHAIAKRGSNGTLHLAEHRTTREGGWTTVLVRTDQLENRVEYYAPLARDGDQVSYRFLWPGTPSEIRRVEFEILEPLGTTGAIVEPAPTHEAFDPDGRRYLLGSLPALAPHQATEIAVRYARAPAEAAAPTPSPAAAAPATVPPPSAHSVLIWVLAGLVVLLSLAVVYLYLRQPKRS